MKLGKIRVLFGDSLALSQIFHGPKIYKPSSRMPLGPIYITITENNRRKGSFFVVAGDDNVLIHQDALETGEHVVDPCDVNLVLRVWDLLPGSLQVVAFIRHGLDITITCTTSFLDAGAPHAYTEAVF